MSEKTETTTQFSSFFFPAFLPLMKSRLLAINLFHRGRGPPTPTTSPNLLCFNKAMLWEHKWRGGGESIVGQSAPFVLSPRQRRRSVRGGKGGGFITRNDLSRFPLPPFFLPLVWHSPRGNGESKYGDHASLQRHNNCSLSFFAPESIVKSCTPPSHRNACRDSGAAAFLLDPRPSPFAFFVQPVVQPHKRSGTGKTQKNRKRRRRSLH